MKHLKLFNSFVNEELNEVSSIDEAKQEHIKYLQDFITRWDDAQENDRDLKSLEAEYNKKLTQFGLPKMSADELLHQLQSKSINEQIDIHDVLSDPMNKLQVKLDNLLFAAKGDSDWVRELNAIKKSFETLEDRISIAAKKLGMIDGVIKESVTEGVVSIKGGRILAHKVLNKLVDMEIIPVKKKTEDLVEAIASLLATTSMAESLNEAFEVHYSDGVRAFKKFGNERQAVEFARELIKSNKGLQFVDVFNAGSGFHSTADTDAIVAWWGDGSYTDNKSKKDPKLAAKKITQGSFWMDESESEVSEGMVQIAGKNKPIGAKVLATIIVDDLMKKDYLKPGADKVKTYLVDDVQDVIMNNTF